MTKLSTKIVLCILQDLQDRAGIKHELGAVERDDPETWEELLKTNIRITEGLLRQAKVLETEILLETKTFELRDRMTLIPVVAVKMQGGIDHRLLWRAGYGPGCEQVLFMRADGDGYARYDPYEWNDRTMRTAHLFIQDAWSQLKDQQVIDVEYILGERPEPKESECGGPPMQTIEKKEKT